MILEAFAKYLHVANPELPAPSVLARWLWERLSVPPETNVDKVLRCEISVVQKGRNGSQTLRLDSGNNGPDYIFQGNSESGRRLLNSLYHYSLSYEQQKWNRWVHQVKASDFNERHDGGA